MLSRELLENVAAISALIHGDKRYHEFYACIGERVGGFPGIYGICIALARQLTSWEEANGGAMAFEEHGLDWPIVTERIAELTLTAGIETGLIDEEKIVKAATTKEGA